MLRAVFFTAIKQVIDNWYVWLLCVEIADIKAGEKMRRNKQELFAFYLGCLSELCWQKQNIILIFFPLLSVSAVFILLIIVIVIVLVVIVVYVVALPCVFHCVFSLFLQVTLTTKIPLTFTATSQSHTRPTAF